MYYVVYRVCFCVWMGGFWWEKQKHSIYLALMIGVFKVQCS